MSGRPVTRPRPGHSPGHGLGLGPSPRYESRFKPKQSSRCNTST